MMVTDHQHSFTRTGSERGVTVVRRPDTQERNSAMVSISSILTLVVSLSLALSVGPAIGSGLLASGTSSPASPGSLSAEPTGGSAPGREAARPETGAGIALACDAERWTMLIEPNHSTIGFAVPIIGGLTKVTGKFTEVEATICFDAEDITRSEVEVVIQAASVDTGIDARDEDLAGPTFFDVANHPQITFRSVRVEEREGGHVSVGDLTMRGVTRRIELPFVITGLDWDHDAPRLGVAASTVINRQDFGVGSDWIHSAIPNFIADEITLDVFMYTHRGERAANAQ